MALDLPAVAIATQAIRIARAAYDVGRDGGAVGMHSCPSQQVPTGSFIVGYAFQMVDNFTSLTTPQLAFMVGPSQTFDPIDLIAVTGGSTLEAGFGRVLLDGSQPITVVVTDADYLTGSLLIWVFYLAP